MRRVVLNSFRVRLKGALLPIRVVRIGVRGRLADES